MLFIREVVGLTRERVGLTGGGGGLLERGLVRGGGLNRENTV